MRLDGTKKTEEEAYKKINDVVMIQTFSRSVLQI
jgi:hypothetical protein